MSKWYEITNVESVPSPSLLVYPDRVRSNIEKIIDIAGDVDRLRPHIKTHKSSDVIKMQLDLGIDKFKCATIAEAEMAAQSGVKDMLLAYQPVGPNVVRFVSLVLQYPDVTFSTVVDNSKTINELSNAAKNRDIFIKVYLDINSGMNRTGIEPNKQAADLYKLINDLPNIEASGLHVYDGHIRDNDPAVRKSNCEHQFEQVFALIKMIENKGLMVPNIIAGGTPTFPVHALHKDRQLSPGTISFWDHGYASSFSDLDFQHAAILITRVVSKLGEHKYCLDLGHKAVASEMAHPRVKFMGIDNYEMLTHSEEHMVIDQQEQSWDVGDALYAIPTHICPTTALHHSVQVVKDGHVIENWEILARKRKLTV